MAGSLLCVAEEGGRTNRPPTLAIQDFFFAYFSTGKRLAVNTMERFDAFEGGVGG